MFINNFSQNDVFQSNMEWVTLPDSFVSFFVLRACFASRNFDKGYIFSVFNDREITTHDISIHVRGIEPRASRSRYCPGYRRENVSEMIGRWNAGLPRLSSYGGNNAFPFS